MILPVHDAIRAAIRHALATLYQLPGDDPTTLAIEVPPIKA